MLPRRLPAASLAAVLAAVTLADPAPARACGGVVFPEHDQRLGGMTDQEVLVAFAGEATVLVASPGYQGAPATGFAFILPLAHEPAEVRDADPALLVAHDEYTAPRVRIVDADNARDPVSLCVPGVDRDVSGDAVHDDIVIRQRGATATYEWVVIGGDTGTAVAAWLTDSGYALPPDYAAALDPYIEAGDFFFAARVTQAASDGALAPIELHLPPMTPDELVLPLALSARSLVPEQPLGVTLYLWSGGPLLPRNYASRAVDDDDLVASSPSESNYLDLERAIVDDGAWIIDHSNPILSTEDLVAAYQAGAAAGRYDATATADGSIRDFFARTGPTGGYLTRLRTALPAHRLADLELRRPLGPLVSNGHVTFYPPEQPTSEACSIGGDGRLLEFLTIVPVLLWIRPRRRRPA